MRIIRGWSKNPNPPRIIIDLHPVPEVKYENITLDEVDGILLAKGLCDLSNGDLRSRCILSLQQNKIPNSKEILELWIQLEKQRRKQEAEERMQPTRKLGYIKPSEVIPRALAGARKQHSEDEEGE